MVPVVTSTLDELRQIPVDDCVLAVDEPQAVQVRGPVDERCSTRTCGLKELCHWLRCVSWDNEQPRYTVVEAAAERRKPEACVKGARENREVLVQRRPKVDEWHLEGVHPNTRSTHF